MSTILITGGTGLVGQRLSQLLTFHDYKVIHLSRKRDLGADYPAYQWDIKKQTIDEEAIRRADYIIHLAGAGIVDQRWTEKRKQVLLSSRIDSANLLYDYLQKTPNQVKAFIGASAIGYYGSRGKEILEETAPPMTNFIGQLVKKWEQGSLQMTALDIRSAVIRVGIVLSKDGGALPKMALSAKMGVAATFGSGNHYQSWIHIDDLCRLFLMAVENEKVTAAYNGVAPKPVTNKELIQQIAKQFPLPTLTLPVPTFLLRLGMGEMQSVLTDSAYVSSKKVEEMGFTFLYPRLDKALKEIYS